MAIEDDIIEWALERPAWQQEVLVALADGVTFTPASISDLVDQVVAGASAEPNLEAKRIQIKSGAVEQVGLYALSDLVGVNALAGGQTLEFGSTGLTVVYGDNGSGKSGYARLVKSLVSARHRAEILPNVFVESPPVPSGVLRYLVDGEERRCVFPGEPPAELLKVSFYDEHCGDEYLARQSTISYRPSALRLLDGLISVCDDVRAQVSVRIKAAQAAALDLDLPVGTSAAAFVGGLAATTTAEEIAEATALPDGFNEALAAALQEEARLAGSDSEREQSRLLALARQVDALLGELTGLLDELAPERVAVRVSLRDAARTAREAAAMAARGSFDQEPLEGVGSDTWRALWVAAREYSVAEAYHDHAFPVAASGSVCVLCQQELGAEAQDRLRRFDRYMTDTTERDALVAERRLAEAVRELTDLAFATPERTAAIAAVSAVDEDLAAAATALLSEAQTFRDALVAQLREGAPAPSPLPASAVPGRLMGVVADLRAKADATDVVGFLAARSAATRAKEALQASSTLANAVEKVHSEVARLVELGRLRAALTAADTNAITRKSSTLTRQYATRRILDQFTRETERLDLRGVTLQDMGGQKGKLNQMPGLLDAVTSAAAPSVLSEGEQTALGLAGFFTEAVFDESRSTIVFDDPVTSLDHQRRRKVADRLVGLAKDRQVVVFTHDASFTGDLSAAAERDGVPLAERSVERRGGTVPGICWQTFPWKAKGVGSRIGDLEAELARMRRDLPALAQRDWEARVAAWAGDLSETWERCVAGEIVNQVFDRGSSKVHLMKFRLLTRIDERDNQDVLDGLAATSLWARRHDKALETNFVAPGIEELEKELDRIRAWRQRIKKYLS
ncbi:AAA family ATPase [Cellulomonas sp. Y8]|uniref:AAA family ATPase n=1 Tax=Cellulomonas sp. Y8 TaxID=2591145 RepID=UPI0011CBDD7E|nr:AAA family ATPase [Cellulomonas sp. Y8]